MSRKLPPYTRQIIEARRGDLRRWWGTSPDGQTPTLICCCGTDAWAVARQWHNHRLVTLCPPDADPWSFDWRCLVGADPLLLWRCGNVVEAHVYELARAILTAGVDRILDVHLGVRYVAQVKGGLHERAA